MFVRRAFVEYEVLKGIRKVRAEKGPYSSQQRVTSIKYSKFHTQNYGFLNPRGLESKGMNSS
jgi:hypothetical protein